MKIFDYILFFLFGILVSKFYSAFAPETSVWVQFTTGFVLGGCYGVYVAFYRNKTPHSSDSGEKA